MRIHGAKSRSKSPEVHGGSPEFKKIPSRRLNIIRVTLSRIEMSVTAVRGWGRRELALYDGKTGDVRVASNLVRSPLLEPSRSRSMLPPPPPKGWRYYQDSTSPIVDPFPFPSLPEVIDTLSTVSRSRHAGWPTYGVDSRWTITRSLMEVRERRQRAIPGCYCGCGFASNYAVSVRRHDAKGLSASASEIWRIHRLSATAFGV